MIQKVLGMTEEFVSNRADAFVNAWTGIGSSLRDKLRATHFEDPDRLSMDELESLYHGEDLAARICEALPEDGLRRWFDIEIKGDGGAEKALAVDEELRRLGAKKALLDAAVWARVYGGAVIHIGMDDGQKQDQPVNEARIRGLRFLTVMDARTVQPVAWYTDPKEPKFREPKMYRIQNETVPGPQGAGASLGMEIHESRLLRFDGVRTSQRRVVANQGWNYSVLQRVNEVLVQHNIGWQGTAHLLQDAAQGVMKIKNLVEMITSKQGQAALNTRMEMVDMSRSIARSMMVDADAEDFHRESYNFGGVPEVLDRFMMRLACAARQPVTVLYGRSPAGLNATGESDIRIWYDSVERWQTDDLQPKAERLITLITLASESTVELKTGDWRIKFRPLWQPTELERATLRKTHAETDKIYLDAQVVLPEEVALSRFQPGGEDKPLQIDLDARKQMLEAEIEAAKASAGEPPPLPPVPGQPGEVPPPGQPKAPPPPAKAPPAKP